MIREITDQKAWDDFLLRQQPNTFLQSWEWGEVQTADGEEVIRLGVFEDEAQVGAAQLIVVHARRGCFLLVPHGPIFESHIVFEAHFPELISWIKKIGREKKAVAIRVAPLAANSEEYKKHFQDLHFHPAPLHIHAERTWVLDISGGEDEILAGMRKTTRHAIRKAEKEQVAVEVVSNPEAISRFWPLYIATKDRHDFTPFKKAFLSQQAETFGKQDRCYFVFAQHEGVDIAAAMMIQFGDTVFYHHGASENIPRGIPAAQLLHWGSIKEAKRRGATHYNFWGIAPEGHSPKHPFAGITIFKQGFGGKVIDYLPLQDLTLSFSYWKLWAIERWRKYRRGF